MIPTLTKAIIDDMQQLRKRIYNEFGVQLKLSQIDIVERIVELAGKSEDQETLLLFSHFRSVIEGQYSIPVAI